MTHPGDPHTLDLLQELHDLRAMNHSRGLALTVAAARLSALEVALRGVLVYAEANPPVPNPPIPCEEPACVGCQPARVWRAALAAAHNVLGSKP